MATVDPSSITVSVDYSRYDQGLSFHAQKWPNPRIKLIRWNCQYWNCVYIVGVKFDIDPTLILGREGSSLWRCLGTVGAIASRSPGCPV